MLEWLQKILVTDMRMFGFRIKEELLENEKEMLKNMSEIQKLDRTRLSCLRKVEKRKMFTEVRKVNEFLKKIESKDVTEDNESLYLGVILVTKVFEKNKRQEKAALVEEKTGKSSYRA